MRKKLLSIAIAFAAVAAFGIGASQEWVKNYVTTLTTSASDDEIKVDENGQLSFSVAQNINGLLTNTVQKLSPAGSELVEGSFFGLRIIDSSSTVYKIGDTFALCYDTDKSKLTFVNGERRLTVVSFNPSQDFPTMGIWTGDGDNEQDHFTWFGALTNRASFIQQLEGVNETAFFTVEPILLFDDTWKNLTKNDPKLVYDPVKDIFPWLDSPTTKETKLRLIFSAPQSKMFRMTRGLENQPTIIELAFLTYPQSPLIDTIDFAAANNYKVDYYGSLTTPTKENCWGEPSMVYDPKEWHKLENWVILPQTVTVYYKADDGLWYPTEKKIRTVSALQNLLAAYPDVKFPPRPWPDFKLVAKENCKLSGDHIYGKDCICIECGHQREHRFESIAPDKCMRCTLPFDSYYVDIHGQKKKKGIGNEICGLTPKQAGGEVFDIELHSGWHHESVEGDESHNCSCECGFYAKNNHLLPHVFNFVGGDTIQESDWSKFDMNGNMDGIHHFAVFTCERCQEAKKEIKEKHKIINLENDAMPAEWVDGEHHHAHGFCEICEFGKAEGENAYLLEEHAFDENCYCEKCDTVNHNWHDRICGNNINRVCTHCALVDGTAGNIAEHDYGEPLEEHHEKYRTHHQCFCGLGELEEHTFENGVCSVCRMRQKTGVKCASKKRGPKAPDSGSVNSDGVHTSDRSGTGGFYCTDLDVTDESDHACPDCGGGFFIDYPEAKAFASAPGAWEYTMSGAMGAETRRWRGEDTALTNTLRTVNSLVGIIERAEKNVGSRVEIKVKWNPSTTIELTFENFAFLPRAKATYGESWGNEAIYSGSIVKDPEFGVIIDWK